VVLFTEQSAAGPAFKEIADRLVATKRAIA